MAKRKKILVGPCEIAGYYRNLCEGFQQLGIPYDFITYHSHSSGYGGETLRPLLLRIAFWFLRLHEGPNRSWITKVLGALPARVFSWVWVGWAICRYDVFIFGFGMSLLKENRDLPILRALGKTVITNLGHGSEGRPPFTNGFLQSREGPPPSVAQLNALTLRVKRRIAYHEKYCDAVIGAPFSNTQFGTRRMINQFALGIPFSPASTIEQIVCSPCSSLRDERSVRILHSPSHPAAKGSPQIILAIENLKQRGYMIDFVLMHGRPFVEVIHEIQQCDFVVDQVFCDTPMAGFATEAAWFGKPAVVGGYALDCLKAYVSEGMWPPSKTCQPHEIEQAIEYLIVNHDARLALGIAAQLFVKQKWSATDVAKRYLRLIEGDIPDEWWLDPYTVSYLEGAGQSVERTRESIRQLVSQYGVESLQLSHRPSLERAFLDFSGVPR